MTRQEFLDKLYSLSVTKTDIIHNAVDNYVYSDSLEELESVFDELIGICIEFARTSQED